MFSIHSAGYVPIEKYLGLSVFFVSASYIISFFLIAGWEGGMELKEMLRGLSPQTLYTKQSTKRVKHDWKWKLSLSLGIVMFMVIFDLLIAGGIILGYSILFGNLALSDLLQFYIWFRESSLEEVSFAAAFVFVLIFIVFSFMYGRAFALADPKIKEKAAMNPYFAFKRTFIMWWTFGHAENVRNLKSQRKMNWESLVGKALMGATIGLLIYWLRGASIAIWLCIGYSLLHELINWLIRVKRA